MNQKHIGSNFDDFLIEQARLDEAWDLRQLGADEQYVAVCPTEEAEQIDAMMEVPKTA